MKQTLLKRGKSQLKRSPLKRKGKSEFSKAKEKAWKAFSLYIRTRDKFTCYTCGKNLKGSRTLHAGHFISRTHASVLFDEINVHAQCMYCNMFLSGNTGIYADNLIRDYGIDKFQDLLKRSRQIKQWKVYELETLADQYEYKLKQLSVDN